MTSTLERIGGAAARRPWLVVGAWVLVAVSVLALGTAMGGELRDTVSAPGLDSTTATELLERAGVGESGVTAQVVATPSDEASTFLDDAEAVTALARLQADLAATDRVVGVSEPATALLTDPRAAVAGGLVSPDGRVAILRVQYPPLEELDGGSLDALLELQGERDGLTVEMGGELFLHYAEADAGLGEVAGLAVAVVVLMVAFGSVIAAGLPIVTAVVGLAVGTSSLSLLALLLEVPAWSTTLAAMIGIGVGIDYALFLVTRHRELLAQGLPVDVAVGRAVATSGRAVLFAGGTVVVSILGLAVAGIPWITAGGVGIAVVVAVTVIASLTLLPALLGLVGHRIVPRRHRDGGAVHRWQRWGTHVADHAVAYAVGATLLLLALAAPALSLRLGLPDDGSKPVATTERRAYDLVADGFGPGANGPLVVAVDTHGDARVVEGLVSSIQRDPGIAGASLAAMDDATGIATIIAIPTTSPQDEATVETVERLRSDVLPTALDGSEATGHVGGTTAIFADLAGRIAERLPWLVAAVIMLSFLLLVVVFRSLLVPLKAALLNLLSIGSAYGVLVAVFQWGWGADLIGLEATVPIISFIPMFMFAIVFGLSMDYEVFLLSRIREEHDRTGDNDAAVVHGLASTGRVITSAALIMVAVFLGFVSSPDPSTKMFGLGLATAIAVDATIVRMILVPATMRLLGEANWWLPAGLDRVIPHVALEAEPQPAMAGS